ERQRNKVLLRGEVDDVGLDALLATLAARGKSCILKVRFGSARGQITLEQGAVVDVRTEGLYGELTGRDAFRSILGWRGATFEVVSDAGGRAAPPRSSSPPPPRPALTGDAADVALAAAVVNACAAYVRSKVGARTTASLLEATWRETKTSHPALEA